MNKNLRLVSITVVILTILALTGCGFHLRGYQQQQSFSVSLQKVYIQSSTPYSPLVHALTQEFNQLHVQVVNSAEQAPVTLIILNDSYSNSQISVAGSQETRQYNIYYNVTIALNDNKGNQIFGPVALIQTGTDTVLANQVLGNNGELDEIYQQLRQEMVNTIMYRITSQEALTAIQKVNAEFSPSSASLPQNDLQHS